MRGKVEKMKWYGSLQNRLEENRQIVNEIKVGDGVTEYYYSDREPWEVIAVKDQKHITIRMLDTKRIDNNGGFSECQEYEYISNPENYSRNIVKRGKYWYSTTTCTLEEFNEIQESAKKETLTNAEIDLIVWAAQFDKEKLEKNGKQTRYYKLDISIGKAEKYYDPSF